MKKMLTIAKFIEKFINQQIKKIQKMRMEMGYKSALRTDIKPDATHEKHRDAYNAKRTVIQNKQKSFNRTMHK